MVRKQFSNGDILYAEDINAIAYPLVDGADFIGHGPKVLDNYLDDGSDQIKSRFYTFYDRFKVSHQAGLTFAFIGGVILRSNGDLSSISAGTINVSDNSTSFIFVGSDGTVQSSNALPNESFPLAVVTTSGGTISGGVIDLRDKVIDRITAASVPSQELVPPGSGMEYFGATLPNGWLWQDGAFYEPSTYPTLFAAIGYTWGQDGTKFKVPDRRGRTSIGAGQGTGLTNRTLGEMVGEEATTLSVSQIPSHGHSVNDPGHSHGISDPGHSHGVYDPGHSHIVRVNRNDGSGHNIADSNGGNEFLFTGDREAITATTDISIYGAGTGLSLFGSGTGISINNQGGGGSHNNMQPSLVCNHIIKI